MIRRLPAWNYGQDAEARRIDAAGHIHVGSKVWRPQPRVRHPDRRAKECPQTHRLFVSSFCGRPQFVEDLNLRNIA
jgi:hypothetical protein